MKGKSLKRIYVAIKNHVINVDFVFLMAQSRIDHFWLGFFFDCHIRTIILRTLNMITANHLINQSVIKGNALSWLLGLL